MSELRKALCSYLDTRRALGFDLRTPASYLRAFVGFLEEQGTPYVTNELALQWARASESSPANCARRLGIVRQFATWLHTVDVRTEVPPHGLMPHRYQSKSPYIYTDEEVSKLMHAARDLNSTKGLRGHTHYTIIGLLAVTGMRVSEAIALDRQDVALEDGFLNIRRTKFGKSRLVPVHASTCEALRGYATARDRVVPTTTTPGFFVCEQGYRITGCAIRYNFAQVSRSVGLRPRDGCRHGHGPRLHDLRHRFAAHTLVEWYRAGLDVEREMPKLSTYLGHVHINDTYWYIEAVPELLRLATERVASWQHEVKS